jgi:GAF domain-containing protein/anti-sigma regulatory factor (Ser/Thr protein kinase)
MSGSNAISMPPSVVADEIITPSNAAPAVRASRKRGRHDLFRRLLKRLTAIRPPLWAVPLAMLLVFGALTIALWRAERALERNNLDVAVFTHRASTLVLWGGLIVAVLTAGFVYFVLQQRNRDYQQTRRYLGSLQSLQSISSTIIARIDAAPSSLGNLCESANQLLAMDRAGILLFDAKTDRLEMLAYAGDMPAEPPKFYDVAKLPHIRSSLETGQIFFAETLPGKTSSAASSLLAYFHVGSLVLIPLTVNNRRIGMLTVSSSEPKRFTDIDRQFAELLGSQAAVILANSSLYQAQQSAVRKYKALLHQRELLFSTNAAIYQAGDLDDVLRRVAELAPTALAVDLCVVALTAEIPHNIRIVASTPGVALRQEVAGTKIYCAAAERAFARNGTCVFEDGTADAELQQLRDAFPELGSVAYVPLSVRDGEPIGILILARRKKGAFSTEQLNMARMFSTRAAAAIDNARLHRETLSSLDEQKALLRERENLWSVNAAVYQAGTLEESLDQIVQLAPPALGVDLCAVDFATDEPGVVRVAAMTGEMGRELVGQTFNVYGLNAGRAIGTGQPLLVEDARNDLGMPEGLREEFRVGSIAYLPLFRSDGKVLGLMVLIRHKPGPFDKARIELARVFANRAASAIETAQLLEQTRRDAATKATLLRELNHRVKNNLAGIVALLSMRQPQMLPDAQRWLDRVTGRVRVMAEAHQLFVGDTESVQLVYLVDRMLSSLSIARSAAAEMRVELEDAAVELQTDHAISLAMVLHELCYNAIVHGLNGKAGTVTIQSRQSPAGRLRIDVIDNGRGHEQAGDDASRGSGIGLELVKGLVSRELCGTFSLASHADGGTIASVEFPLRTHRIEQETS